MFFRNVVKLYENNSVSICGKKGRGKDILTANVIARRKRPYYISNVDYKVKKSKLIRFNPSLLRIGNDYRSFIDNKIKEYIYPYPDGTDIYISDCGVYFPAQYCSNLNRDYSDIPTFMALSRQLGDCYVHTNAQALNRVWDKIREQSDMYISCQWCKVFFGKIVVQSIRIYEKYESAVTNQPPCRLTMPLLGNSVSRSNIRIAREQYTSSYGKIRSCLLIYWNKSKYDTRLFKTILENCKEYIYEEKEI